MELRPYQTDACNALVKAWQANHKSVLLELGPGSGKSVICAEICRKALPITKRVLVLCHQQEILKQNQDALGRLAPEISSSIYCEGLQEKSLAGQVVFAHRDSFGLLADKPKYPLAIIDECHMVSTRKTSRYQQILGAIEASYLVGLTATPYRLSGGAIFGKNKPFEVRAYQMGIKELIEKGSLCKFKFIEDDPQIVAGETTNIDYEALGALAIQEKENKRAIKLIRKHTKDLKTVLIYCCSVAHAEAITQGLGQECKLLTGTTPQREREQIITDLRNGSLRYCANIGVLTTGTDIPRVDGIVMLRPTLSASLYIQAIGRGLRPHPDKTELTIVELTDNLIRFGDLDDPMLYGKDYETEADDIELEGECPTKECPGCNMMVNAPVRVCPHCGYMFIRKREEFDSMEVLELKVLDYSAERTTTRNGHEAIVVTFKTEIGELKEWLNINNPNQWVAQNALAKLRRIRGLTKIGRIRARAVNETFPKIYTYHT